MSWARSNPDWLNVPFAQNRLCSRHENWVFDQTMGSGLSYHKSMNPEGGNEMSGVVGGYGCGVNPFASTGAILVLFILLVIITRSFWI
jgi:hypothetical protein